MSPGHPKARVLYERCELIYFKWRRRYCKEYYVFEFVCSMRNLAEVRLPGMQIPDNVEGIFSIDSTQSCSLIQDNISHYVTLSNTYFPGLSHAL